MSGEITRGTVVGKAGPGVGGTTQCIAAINTLYSSDIKEVSFEYIDDYSFIKDGKDIIVQVKSDMSGQLTNKKIYCERLMGHIGKGKPMRTKQKYNYGEKMIGVRKGIKAKKKTLVTKHFCEKYSDRHDKNTGHGRTTARNLIVGGVKLYNLGKLRTNRSRGNGVPKRKVPLSELDESDLLVYQEIVDSLVEDFNISKDEIAKRIIERKKKIKNQKKMAEAFDLSRKIFYRKQNRNVPNIKKDREGLYVVIGRFKRGLNRNLGLLATREALIKNSLIDKTTTVWDVRIACEDLCLMSNRVGRPSTKPKEKKDTSHYKPNLLKNLLVKQINHVGATDVSYIRVKGGFVYLSAVIDVYSKKLLGGKVSSRNDTDLVMDSIKKAIAKYGVPNIIHSDNGYQYTSKIYMDFMSLKEIKISKSSPGKSLENREIEFGFGLLKREHLYKLKLSTLDNANDEIKYYINGFNDVRMKLVNKELQVGATPTECHTNVSR